jgi:agmatine/peptidylarginine deiminase
VVAQWGLVVVVMVLAAVFWLTRPVAPASAVTSPVDRVIPASHEGARGANSQTEGPFNPHAARIRVPAEFEAQSALILGCNELSQYHRTTMLEVIHALHDKLHLIGLVNDAAQQLEVADAVVAAGLHPSAIQLLVVPAKGMWVRDYGPMFVITEHGQLHMLDARYRQKRPTDDNVPVELANFFQMPRFDVPLLMEGGNLLSNGQGLCLTSSAMMVWNEELGHDIYQIGDILAGYFGFDNWVYLQPPLGEPTGHIDMFCTLVAPNVAVVGQIDPHQDAENARILDEGAAVLRSTHTRSGPMQVVRIPMPPCSDGHWRSYTNVIFANGTLLVPTYPKVCPDLDRQALDTYRRLLPNWKVVPIDASTIITKRGALHCVSINVPRSTALLTAETP